jgi:type IV pilus assembly protein PilY1
MLKRFFISTRLALAMCISFSLSVAVPAAPPPTVDLSDSPILASGRGPASNLLLSLSVEFPTVGAAYRSATYDNAVRTLGYWDADTCYTYQTLGVPSELEKDYPGVGAPAGFFRRSRTATNFQCGGTGEYSGNFMNWAALSAVDSLRYALTGGDRIVDTTTQTILQRADIPTNFYRNGSYFPSKTLANANLYTPFTGTVQIASCRYVIYIGTASAGGCGNPGTNGNLAQLRAAVEVCDATEGPIRSDLCRVQASTNYKPTGLMQQYADRIRFAAFGYALDSGNTRYGGVLRAPMKYVGVNAYNSSFTRFDNPSPEWDATTGVFIDAPLTLQANTTFSGVANYLNRFGRVRYATRALTTALTDKVQYKGNDPVSELYYEGLRYLQGQTASPQVTATSFTAAMYDEFPIYTNWLSTAVPDPITSACQSTSIIQIADHNTHNDKTIPGNSRIDGTGDSARSASATEPNAVVWTGKVGDFEGRSTLGTDNTGSDAAAYYISGLAYWANTQPIRADKPKIRARTFVIDVDENGDGRVSTKRSQQLYLAAKYGGFVDDNNDASPFKIGAGGAADNSEWASGVDDAGNPLPRTFFLASSPSKMIAALRSAFAEIANSTGTLSGGSLSSSRISTGGTDAFVSRLDNKNDAATVLAFALTYNTTTQAVTIANAARWNATDKLTGNSTLGIAARAPATRKIFSSKTDGSTIEFLWTNLDSSQQALFNKNPSTGVVDNLGSKRVDYLRGIRTDEENKGTAGSPKPFRNRTSLVAAIVNSAPVYVGAKPANTVSGEGYEAFYRTTNRDATVYVGTNNGMLHAFSASDGTELFGYVPRPFVPLLPTLTSPDYVKQPMVDAPPVIGDAQIGSTGTAADWRTVLISGYGGGSQGVFALDVTKPADFSTSSVLWDFSDKDDPKMGNLVSAPKLLKFRTGTTTFKWFAVFPSGYNNNKVDSAANALPVLYDANNTRSLFLLALNKPSTSTWALGTNYFRIDLPSGYQDTALANALSSPGVELGVDGEVLRLYAGDIQGNLWKFDFKSTKNAFASNSALQAVIGFGGASGKPLFTAMNGNDRQPITVEPVVGTGPGRTNVIVFGTGKFVEGADTVTANYKQQSIYGIWDDLTNVAASRVTATSQLQQRSASGSGASFSVSGANFTYAYTGTDVTKKMGWYFDLPGLSKGERQVTNFAVANSSVFFNTLATANTTSANACAAYGGRQCAVNGASGLSNGATCTANDEGFLPTPVVVEPDVDLVTPTSGQGSAVRLSQPLVVTFVGTPAEGAAANTAGRPSVLRGPVSRQQTRRLNWREVVDYDRLKESFK